MFSSHYTEKLEKNFKDRETIAKILKILIDEIVVYTRPVRADDPVAGRKKKDQQIPDRIHIKLKLPSEILHEIVSKEKVYSVERIGFEDGDDTSSGLKTIARAR